MLTLFEHLQNLYENELYSNTINLATFLLSAYEQNRSLLNAQQHFVTQMYYGESLFNEYRFRRAEHIFRQALQAKKILVKMKPFVKNEMASDIFTEPEIKYKIAKCFWEIRRTDDAINILQSISIKQRSPKINSLLGKLCHYTRNERCSVSAYKEVIRECPLAMEAIEALLSMGIRGNEVNSLIVDTTLSHQCSDWFSNWIRANDNIYNQKYPQAIQILKTIEANSFIKNTNQLLSLMGEVYYFSGEYELSMNYLKRAQSLYGATNKGIMTYAVILAKKNKHAELEKLIIPTSSTNEYTTEMWFIMAQYLFSTKKFEKAAYFAQKAVFLNPKNFEALLLKAKVYVELKKHQEAIMQFRMIQQVAPHRFEVYQGLVATYIQLHQIRDAQNLANVAIKEIGQNAMTLTLLATTFLRDGNKAKAKTYLQKALELNENYLPAVIMLVELLQDEGDTTAAINLLKKQVSVQPNCKLHSMLGDMLHEKDHSGALENYTVALNFDPSNRKALDALMDIGSNNPVDNSCTTSSTTEETAEFQELLDVPPVPDPEESDAVWSDVEIEMSNG